MQSFSDASLLKKRSLDLSWPIILPQVRKSNLSNTENEQGWDKSPRSPPGSSSLLVLPENWLVCNSDSDVLKKEKETLRTL